MFRNADDPEDAVEVWRASSGALHIGFSDGTSAFVDVSERTIRLWWPPAMSFDDAITYLVGPVLGAVLRVEGRQVLHASAVEVGGGAVAVFGPAGAGKSTTTAALLERGFSLVTEDVAALATESTVGAEGRATEAGVYRGGARVKLWEDSVEALRGRVDALPRIVPSSTWWPKRFLEARVVDNDVTPLRALFALERRSVPRAFVEELSGSERVMSLVSNVYAGGLLDAAGRARQLAALTEVAKTVSVRRLVVPDALSSLNETVDVLLESL